MSREIAKSTVGELSRYLDKLKPQIELSLPSHMSADRMARLALTAFSSNEKLQECNQKSIASSIMTAGQLGLEPGVNGAGFLVPYGETCTFVPGWKGLVDLVSRSGRGTVYTGVIYSDQEYTFKDGAIRDLVVNNETDMINPIDITHAFAIGWVKDAQFPIIELWSVKKLTAHRNLYNKIGKRHYSYKNWEMYCRKIPLLQVIKYMPASIELANAIDVDNAAESGGGVTIEDGIVIDNGFHSDSAKDPIKEKEFYPAADFEKKLPGWQKIITDGKKTADQIIAMAGSKHPLTDDQKAAIKKPIAGDGAGITFASVMDKLQSADNVDDLDLSADLIGDIADEAQRAELMQAYKLNKDKMGAE